jgi:hypothetical protein
LTFRDYLGFKLKPSFLTLFFFFFFVFVFFFVFFSEEQGEEERGYGVLKNLSSARTACCVSTQR